MGAPILLANTYHLLLRPGPELFRRVGGLHAFMGWPRPVLTDSGGYQIFSLPGDRTIDERGARFRSYVDSRIQHLTPETSIEMQAAIGSDIMMVLDVCIPSTAEEGAVRAAMERTHRWALRSLAARKNPAQALFAIVQGGLSRSCGGNRPPSSPTTLSTASRSAAWRWATRGPSARTSRAWRSSSFRRRRRGT